jgi:hypothetical protein
MAIATQMFGREKIYDADAICATQNHGKVRQTFIDIATLPLGLKKKMETEKMDVGIRD